MKTWGNIAANDCVYLLKWHHSGGGYSEIRRCKVIEIRKPTETYVKIVFKHPKNINDKSLSWMKTETFEWTLLKSNESLSDKDFTKRPLKFLLMTEFNEDIVEEFDKSHRT